LEIAANTDRRTEEDPPNSCEWNWLIMNVTGEYAFTGTHGDPGEGKWGPSIYASGGERAYDLQFCVDSWVEINGRESSQSL